MKKALGTHDTLTGNFMFMLMNPRRRNRAAEKGLGK